jgi:large subunit ribosomal protein L21
MFAVLRTGGKQYRVHPGDKIVVEKLDGNAGDKITLGDILLAGDGGSLKSTNGLTIAAEIVAQAKADKVTVFKKRRRHNYRRKKGHRQQHTILKILAIGDQKEQKSSAKADKAPKAASTADQAPKPEKSPKSDETKVQEDAQKSGDVAGKPTENPAPDDQSQANPPGQSADANAKVEKKAAPAKGAKPASTKNAAPAKGAAKKAPKGK